MTTTPGSKVTLYIATHNITGLKYFGKTTKYYTQLELQQYYHGSGVYWKKHLKKHGNDVTMELYGIFSVKIVEQIAINFSIDNNIVENTEWANLKNENGLDGNIAGVPLSEKHKAAIKLASKTKKKDSEYTKRKRAKSLTGSGNGMFGKTVSDETKNKWQRQGSDNPSAKVIYICDNNDNIVYVSNGNFFDTCKKHDLPSESFKLSHQHGGTRLYTIRKPIKKKYIKYVGWYAIKENEYHIKNV